jgi:6,7-dimethyl-8-ribityllumazine synthase
MGKILSGNLTVENRKFALVASRFNDFIVQHLVDGAVDALVRHGADPEDIDTIWTPGSFEIPQVARRAAATERYDAVICLGCVIRGSTPHFEYVAAEAAKGVAHVAMESRAPVSFGVLTTDTIEQAVERAGTKAGNKGADAALAAVELVNLYEML